MKNSKIKYGIAGLALLLVVVGYWYATSTMTTGTDDRRLIARSAIKPGEVSPVSVSMTKKQAYEERSRESAEENAKLDFVLENQRPQKLAESVTRAMKSPYQKKLDEMKSERSTVPIYDGKAFSLSQEHTDSEKQKDAPIQPATKRSVHKPPSPKSKPEIKKTISQPAIESVVETDVFNTTSIEPGPGASPSHEDIDRKGDDGAMIKASVFGEQAIKAGGYLKFRLLEKATIDGITFERNTLFSGSCTFGQDRLLVIVDKISLTSGSYKKVYLVIHDPTDFQEGLFAPSDKTKEGAVDATSNSVEQIISGVSTPGMSIGAGVARIFKTAVNGTQKITVPDGHQVIFLTKTL